MSRRWGLRLAGAVSFALLTVILLGCMSLSFGERVVMSPCEGEVFTQEGKGNLPINEERDVYYPASFASPPNLEISSVFNSVTILEQHRDRFRVVRKSGFPEFSWTAKGARGRAVALPAPPENVPPPTTLPDKPVPVETPKP